MMLRARFATNEAKTEFPEDGFSMLEMLVGMMIVGVVATSLAALLHTSMMSTTISADLTEQTVGAAAQLEWLMVLADDDPELDLGGDLAQSVAGYSVDPYGGDPDRYLRWQITRESALLRRIVVLSGSREPAQGPERALRVETFRLDKG